MKFWIDFVGIIVVLIGYNDIEGFQCFQIKGILKCVSGFVKRWCSLIKLRSRKVDRVNGVEVVFFNYVLYENGVDYIVLVDKINIFYKCFFL